MMKLKNCHSGQGQLLYPAECKTARVQLLVSSRMRQGRKRRDVVTAVSASTVVSLAIGFTRTGSTSRLQRASREAR